MMKLALELILLMSDLEKNHDWSYDLPFSFVSLANSYPSVSELARGTVHSYSLIGPKISFIVVPSSEQVELPELEVRVWEFFLESFNGCLPSSLNMSQLILREKSVSVE